MWIHDKVVPIGIMTGLLGILEAAQFCICEYTYTQSDSGFKSTSLLSSIWGLFLTESLQRTAGMGMLCTSQDNLKVGYDGAKKTIKEDGKILRRKAHNLGHHHHGHGAAGAQPGYG